MLSSSDGEVDRLLSLETHKSFDYPICGNVGGRPRILSVEQSHRSPVRILLGCVREEELRQPRFTLISRSVATDVENKEKKELENRKTER